MSYMDLLGYICATVLTLGIVTLAAVGIVMLIVTVWDEYK